MPRGSRRADARRRALDAARWWTDAVARAAEARRLRNARSRAGQARRARVQLRRGVHRARASARLSPRLRISLVVDDARGARNSGVDATTITMYRLAAFVAIAACNSAPP